MGHYTERAKFLREELAQKISEYVEKYGEIIFYDVESGATFIDAAVGPLNSCGAYNDVTRIYRSANPRSGIVIETIDSEYEIKEYDIDDIAISIGDLASLVDEIGFFFAGNQEQKFSR